MASANGQGGIDEEFVGDESEADAEELTRLHWRMFLERSRDPEPFKVYCPEVVLPPVQPFIKQEYPAHINPPQPGPPVAAAYLPRPPSPSPASSADFPPDFTFPVLNLPPAPSRFRRNGGPPQPAKKPVQNPTKKAPSFGERFRRAPAASSTVAVEKKPISSLFTAVTLPASPGEDVKSILSAAPVGDVVQVPVEPREGFPPFAGMIGSPLVFDGSSGHSDGSEGSVGSASSVSSGFGSLDEDSDMDSRPPLDRGGWSPESPKPVARSFRFQRSDTEDGYSRTQFEESRVLQEAAERKRQAELEAQAMEAKLAGLRRQYEIEQQRLEQTRKQSSKMIPPPPRSKTELLASATASLYPEIVLSAHRMVVDHIQTPYVAPAPAVPVVARVPLPKKKPTRTKIDLSEASIAKTSRSRAIKEMESFEAAAEEEARPFRRKNALSLKNTPSGRQSCASESQKRKSMETDGYESEEL